ncbi:helix-turn-helix domain-containing protein [Tepidanaerobacter sp. GT38]|nr:helix-turn-helix domain-containing protein [Tepidanaerobacter sp. GT38]
MTTEKWSSLEEIAEHLGVSKDTIYRWISTKQMPAHKVGKLWKFKISEVDEWVLKGEASDK